MEPKVKIGDYEAKLKAKRERAAQLKAQLDTMEVSFAKLPELTPRVSRTSSPHYLTQHGHASKKSGRQRRQQEQAASASGSSAAQATHSTPRAASSGGGSSSGRKGTNKSSGRKNVRVTHNHSFSQGFLCAAGTPRMVLTLRHVRSIVRSGRHQGGNRTAPVPGCPKLPDDPKSSSQSTSPIGYSDEQRTAS
eukprot:COSAG02_NODE_738_length_17838_cov_10.051412_4_plen_192_part_00